MLDADRGRDPHAMATALRQLPQQGLPSDVVVPGLLDGLGNVCRLVARQFAHVHHGPAPIDILRGPQGPDNASGSNAAVPGPTNSTNPPYSFLIQITPRR